MMEMVVFSMKIMGSIIIFLSGSMYGMMYSRNVQKQYDELQLWMQGCTFICEHGGDFCFQTVCKLFREGTHKHVPPKVERRLGIEGCDRRSDLR